MVAGIGPQQREGLHHLDPGVLGDDALGLFDDDAAVERIGQLFVEGAQVKVCAVVEYARLATSARHCAAFMSASSSRLSWAWNRLSAPMVCFRRRMGRA